MSTMLPHQQYFKRYGVVMPSHLNTPRIFPLTTLTLPRGTFLHYVAESKTEYGPSSDDPLLIGAPRLIFVNHVTELTAHQGNPRSAFVQPAPLIAQYRRKYRKLRLLTKMEIADREPMNILVNNYALLPHMYKYIRSYFTTYYTWCNIQATVWDQVAARMNDTKRNQYMALNLPAVLPSLSQLRLAERAQTRATLEAFTTPESLGVLELWMWLGKNRQNSLIGRVGAEHLDRIDYLIFCKGYWLTINLGVLDSWRKKEESDPKGLTPDMIQIRFLKMLTTLQESTTSLDDGKKVKPVEFAPAAGTVDAVNEEPKSATHDEDVAKQLMDLSEFDDDEIKDLEILNKEPDLNDSELDDDGTVYDDDGNILDEKSSGTPSAVENTFVTTRTLESAILAKSDALADKGMLSGAEYRRLQKLAGTYKNIKDPYGSGVTLEEAMTIKPEDLMVTPSMPIPDLPEVLDKSMLASTVSNIDKQYISKVLNKDIMSSVLSLQHAGIAVTGYTVENIVDAVSDFEVHSITVQPTVGRQSTIRFRLPKVQPNGTFISNGSAYRLRKQRSELPIVKVNPTRVALTSYYSKLFVDKSDRAVFNYDKWVATQVIAAALSDSNRHIGDIKIASVADNSVRTPTIYSALAERCAGFVIHRDDWRNELPKTVAWNQFQKDDSSNSMSIVMNFDYNNRFKSGLFDEKAVAKLERAGTHIVVGRVGHAYVVVDYNNVFYVVNDGAMQVVGRIEDIIDLPIEKAPAPMAELKIFSKSIPVGVVLSYLMGLSNLLKMVGVQPRRVNNGQRLNLMNDEFAVRFLDESLIFQKDDVKASLLFSGFNLYHATIRNYSVYSFDKKDVYMNVLDAYGVGVRFLRELDLMNAMWVDPITQSLLEQMNEPVEYVRLLLRAVDMLVTRYVPTKLENAEAGFDGLERCRGYERFAGVIYSELVKSVRTYNTRTATSAASLSMNPHDVWVNITQDPAAELVNEANPIHNIKEKEVITFGGRGGRSQRSMVAEHRLYKKSDMGFISEATVDSGQVAIITYLSPNANFTSVRGTVRSYDEERDGSSSLLSTAALLAPGADRDDPKRVNGLLYTLRCIEQLP